MIAIQIDSQCDKLEERQREITRTMEHVRGEQRIVDENKQTIERAAYLKRCRLLDGLIRWYADENKRIDAALRRIREGDYGVCARCGQRIDDQRLEHHPDAVLCERCHKPEPQFRCA